MNAATGGLISAFLSACLALAVLFGVNLSPDQIAGVLLVFSTGYAILLAIFAKASPVAKLLRRS